MSEEDSIENVPGIGEKTAEKLKERMTIDLRQATGVLNVRSI